MAFNIPKSPAEEHYYYGPTDEYIIKDGTGKVHRIPGSQLKDQFTPPWANVAQSINKNPNPHTAHNVERNEWRHRAIYMRLRIPEGGNHPFQYMSSAYAGDKVFVFVVQDNQAVTLEDDATMFPSDQLITQLRLLEK